MIEAGLHIRNNLVSDGLMIILHFFNLLQGRSGRALFEIMLITSPSTSEILLSTFQIIRSMALLGSIKQ